MYLLHYVVNKIMGLLKTNVEILKMSGNNIKKDLCIYFMKLCTFEKRLEGNCHNGSRACVRLNEIVDDT